MKLGAFFEILPLLAFFVGYQYLGLIAAAGCQLPVAGLFLLSPGFKTDVWPPSPCWPCQQHLPLMAGW